MNELTRLTDTEVAEIHDRHTGFLARRLQAERERTAALEAKLALVQAQADGTGSLLLDVQQDCIALRKEIRKRVEKWSADDCDLAPFECASDLEAALKENPNAN